MTAVAIWIILAVGLALVITVLKMARDSSRRREQMDALMSRLEQLEERLALAAVEESTASVSRPEEESDASRGEVFSADVLAGKSSHVARMISELVSPSDLADQAVVSIYRRIEDAIQPSDLADELCVSLRTLERGLARSLECTPGQLILTVKMREARRLLSSGQFRVGEVAHRLAFADAPHFSRRYRRFYRCPPSAHIERGESGAAVN